MFPVIIFQCQFCSDTYFLNYVNEISLQKNKIMTSEDTLAFIKQRSVVESRNHSWQKSKKNNDAPGIKMLVVKVDSPDKIVLKHDDHSFAK